MTPPTDTKPSNTAAADDAVDLTVNDEELCYEHAEWVECPCLELGEANCSRCDGDGEYIVEYCCDEEPPCCEYAEWVDCRCYAFGEEANCSRCDGDGEYVAEHCCVCGGSPYCHCCPKCDSGESVAKCTCPITVRLVSGKTTTV